jgi:hypothetical protein
MQPLRITKGKQMPRKGKSIVKRAGGALARTAKKVTSKARKMTARLNPRKRAAANVAATPAKQTARPRSASATARPKQNQTDIPLDLIAAMYSPKQTSGKTSFRSSGVDQQNDQEMPLGAGDRWQDEDHFTNRSGDARIGTHGRSYEPGETRR